MGAAMDQPSPIISTVHKAVPLSHSPICLEARSVHFADDSAMQVALSATTRFHASETFMTTAEARALAQALVEAADHFEAQAAKLVASQPETAEA